MFVLITYDVATRSEGGARRLRQIARVCLDHGQRVQYSVFECKLTPAQLVQLRHKLVNVADLTADSIRIYPLGRELEVEHLGAKRSYDVDGPLVI